MVPFQYLSIVFFLCRFYEKRFVFAQQNLYRQRQAHLNFLVMVFMCVFMTKTYAETLTKADPRNYVINAKLLFF